MVWVEIFVYGSDFVGNKLVNLKVNLYILFCVFGLMADMCLFCNVLKIK